jgi:hypothetical protein
MKSLFAAFFFCMFSGAAVCQSNSFSLLKYSIPGNWQQQLREHSASYSGNEPETKAWMEIRVFNAEQMPGKPDSSFRQTWRRIFANDNASIPSIKKRFNEAGLQVLNNVGVTSPYTENNQKMVSQLVMVVVGNQFQPIQILTINDKDLKQLRPFIDSFIDSIDTVVKLK